MGPAYDRSVTSVVGKVDNDACCHYDLTCLAISSFAQNLHITTSTSPIHKTVYRHQYAQPNVDTMGIHYDQVAMPVNTLCEIRGHTLHHY